MMESFTTEGLDTSTCADVPSPVHAELNSARKLTRLKERLESVGNVPELTERPIRSRKQVKAQSLTPGKEALTLQLRLCHLRQWKRFCVRWKIRITEPIQELDGFVFISLRGFKIAWHELRKQHWAKLLDQPIASVLGEHGTSITGQRLSPPQSGFNNPCPRPMPKPDGRERLRREAEERRDNKITEIIGGTLDKRPSKDKARGTVQGHGLEIEGNYLAYRDIREGVEVSAKTEVEIPPELPNTWAKSTRNVALEFAERDKLSRNLAEPREPSPSIG